MVRDATLLFTDGGELTSYFATLLVSNSVTLYHHVTWDNGLPSKLHLKIAVLLSFLVILCGEVKILGGSEEVYGKYINPSLIQIHFIV